MKGDGKLNLSKDKTGAALRRGNHVPVVAWALCALTAFSALALGCGMNRVRGAGEVDSGAGHAAQRVQTVVVWRQSGKMDTEQFSPPDFMDLKEQVRAFEHFAAFVPGAVDLTPSGGPSALLHRTSISNEFFTVLGLKPAIGRAFNAEEDRPGNDRVAILSHELWSRRFKSDAGMVGKKISLGGEEHTVVGVMPQGFRYPQPSEFAADFEFPSRTDIWTPLALEYRQMSRGLNFLRVIARLRDGVSPRQAEAEMDTWLSRRGPKGMDAGGEWRLRVTPFVTSR